MCSPLVFDCPASEIHVSVYSLGWEHQVSQAYHKIPVREIRHWLLVGGYCLEEKEPAMSLPVSASEPEGVLWLVENVGMSKGL